MVELKFDEMLKEIDFRFKEYGAERDKHRPYLELKIQWLQFLSKFVNTARVNIFFQNKEEMIYVKAYKYKKQLPGVKRRFKVEKEYRLVFVDYDQYIYYSSKHIDDIYRILGIW